MSSAAIEHADGLPLPQRYWAILTIALGLIMAVMDGAIANVALPTIAKDLDAAPAFSIWIVNGYQLAITISLLPLASLGEIIGYRRVYLAGLVLFTLASVFCALSHSLLLLTLARIIQGFGAAGIMSVNTALVRFIYPRAQLGRGIGINAMVVAVSAALGPTVAAGILAVATWPYLFAVNIPAGLAALALGWHYLPHIARAPHMFDWQSACLSALTFGFAIAAIDSAGHGETWAVCLPGIGGRSARRRAAGLPADAYGVAALAGRPAAHSRVRAVDCDLDRVLLRPDARPDSDPLLSPEPLRIFGRSDRSFHHALADHGRLCSPDRRTAGRALPGGTAGRHRTRAVCSRPRRARVDPGRSLGAQCHLAHGARGRGLRSVPDTQ